jgi:hypothetical protein
MAKDLSTLWWNFSLTEEESLEVEAIDQALIGMFQRGRSYLVGKLIADQIIGKDAVKSTLVRGWKPTRTIAFKVLRDNLFIVEFEHVWDKSRVLEGRPWVFKGNLFSIEDFIGAITPAKMDFEKAAFWVRMFNVPLACMSEIMEVQIGNSVGVMEEVETEEDKIGWGGIFALKYGWISSSLWLGDGFSNSKVSPHGLPFSMSASLNFVFIVASYTMVLWVVWDWKGVFTREQLRQFNLELGSEHLLSLNVLILDMDCMKCLQNSNQQIFLMWRQQEAQRVQAIAMVNIVRRMVGFLVRINLTLFWWITVVEGVALGKVWPP